MTLNTAITCISSDLSWQLTVIFTGICQITSGLNSSQPRCVFHQVSALGGKPCLIPNLHFWQYELLFVTDRASG